MARGKKRKKSRAAEAARRRAEKHQTGYENTVLNLPEGVEMFALKAAGTKRIDIIPFIAGKGNPWADKGTEHYERTFWVHRGIGINQNSYVCPAKTAGKKCPICEHLAKLARDPNADEDLIKSLAPRERQLFNVIDLSNKDKGIQIWDVSFHLFGKQLDARIRNQDDDDGYDQFCELEDGLTLKLGVEEKSFSGFSFYAVETIDFKPRKQDYDADLVNEAPVLDDLLKILRYEELKAVFLQLEPNNSNDDDEPDDDDPDDDEQDDDEKDDDDQDEDEHDDEPDDDDDDDDDDEEDEKPSPKPKSKTKGASKNSPKSSKNKSSKKKNAGKQSKGKTCPAGGTFGKDTDELPECDDCDLWDECDDAKYST